MVKIEINDSLNKNKLFNYVLQALETERNILILDKLSKIDLNQKSIPILYTYDSILFDVQEDEEIILGSKKSNGKRWIPYTIRNRKRL